MILLFLALVAAGGVVAVGAEGSVATVDEHNTTVNESDTAGVVTTNSVNATAVESGLSISPSNISVQGGRADIAFLIDTSTSMDNQIRSVKEGLREFSNTLEGQGVDARYAFVTFATTSSEPRYTVVQEYTSNFTETQRTLNNSVGTDLGGSEYSYDAIDGTLDDLNARSDAEEFIVTLTDEDTESDSNPNDPAALADRLESEDATLFAVTLPNGATNNLGATVQPDLSVGRVANLTRDGRFFDIRDDFSTKFEDAISGAIVNRSSPLDVSVTQVQRSGFPEVDVYAEVSDVDGNPVTGLDAGDFTVTEDGVRQTIDSVETVGSAPGSDVSVALAIDRSGSMEDGAPSKLDQAENAAIEFVRQLGPNDEGSIVSFADDARIDQYWTRSNQELIDAIDFDADGLTELYGGTIQAVEQAAPRSGRSAVIVLTDGVPDSDSATLSEAIDTARNRNVPVYTIGLGAGVLEQDLRTLAAETGGDYYRAPTAGDLGAIYQEISQQISNEYRITYTTTNTATDGTTRVVRTTADNGTYQDSDTGQYTAPCAPLPTADFTTATSGQTVAFDGSPSTGNGGSIVAYRWDFTNDGQIDATGQRVSHTYSSSGTYEARLVVEKGCGVTDATTAEVTVGSGGGVTINATDAAASQGGTTTVELRAEGADVAGYSAALQFDPSELQVVDVTGVDFDDPVANIDNSAGSVVLSQSQTTAVSDPVLAEITVEAVGQPGQSALLTFGSSRTTLNDATSGIPIDNYDGSTVTIRSCRAGDANMDNAVTPLDATLVNRAVAGLPVPSTYNADCADYDDSGTVTPLDATLILRDVAGLPTAASASTTVPSAASTADLQIGSVRAAPGESVTVPLSVSGVDVAGYSAQVSFDPNVVQVESATGIDLASPVVNIDNGSGSVTLSASQSTGVTDPTVAVLNLTVVGTAGDTSPLTLDPSGSTVNNVTSSHDVTTTNGSVTVQSTSGTQTAVEVVPASANTGVGGTQTFEVVLSDGSDSQGYDLSVSLDNGTVGRITDAATAGNPGLADTVQINSANDSVEIEGAYLNPRSGSAPLTIATVTVEGNAVGTATVSVDSGSAVRDGNNDPYAITAFNSATLSVQNAVTLPGAAGPAGDVDGDGLLEDVDGDGSANVFDAIALYNNRNAQAVRSNPQFFDFDGDGSVNVFDAIELYNEL